MEETQEKKKTTRQAKPKDLTLVQKLLEVRKSVDYLQKTSKGAQFSYTSSSQVLASVRKAMNEQGLLLTTAITSSNVRENLTKTGTVVYFTEIWVDMTWINVDTGEELSLPFYAQGVDLAGEKGVGKALTYCEKYFILKQFNIPTDKDDPDAFQEKHQPVDVKNALIVQLSETKDIQVVANIWTQNPNLQTDADFKKACSDAKKRLKPEPEPVKEQSDA